MVTHIVIPPAPAPEDEPPRPWPPDDPHYRVLTDPRVSMAVRLWALLHLEPHRMADLSDFLGQPPPRVHSAIARLRKHQQAVIRTGRLYRLDPSPPLQIALVPEHGVILRPGGGRCEHVWYRITCHIRDGIPRIEVLDPPAPPPVEPPAGRHPLWRPTRGDYAASRHLPPRSASVWAWGLLKSGAWTKRDLARELDLTTCQATQIITNLRRHGHRVQCDTCDRYYIREDLPLRVVQSVRGLILARRDGRDDRLAFDLW